MIRISGAFPGWRRGNTSTQVLAAALRWTGPQALSTVVGRRSMIQVTLDRIQQLIPPERVLIVVATQQREEVAQQLARWPQQNIIYQPTNRDTGAGIFLPLAHLSHRDPLATVAVFPSDHFVLDEEK